MMECAENAQGVLVKVEGQSECEHITTDAIKGIQMTCDGNIWTADISDELKNVKIEQIVCKVPITPPPSKRF